MHYIGQVDTARQQKAVNHVLEVQKEDGGWSIYFGGPSDLNATVKCAFALQLAGFTHSHLALIKAGDCIRRLGGLQKIHSYNRFYLGLFGLYPWGKSRFRFPRNSCSCQHHFILIFMKFHHGQGRF